MFAAFIALLALVHLGAAQFDFVSCNMTTLDTCHKAFLGSLQMANSNWYDYKNNRKYVESRYANGQLYGLQLVCKYFGDFKRCFSSTTGPQAFAAYQACTEQPLGLLVDENNNQRLLYTKAQAQGYVKFIAQFDFACGAGLGVFAENDACMSSVFKNNTGNLEFCQDLFDYYMALPNADNLVCGYQSTAMDCYRQQFAQCGIQSGWFGCEYERTGTAALYSQCTQNFCSADTHDE